MIVEINFSKKSMVFSLRFKKTYIQEKRKKHMKRKDLKEDILLLTFLRLG